MEKQSTNLPDIRLQDREQAQYLLGNPPSWMMRYGISVMAGIFLLLLTLSYFIHYPDVIDAKIVLTTANPPIRLFTRSGGRVAGLLVADKQPVEKGQVLAVMENTAQWRDVLRLEAWLDSAAAQPESPPAGLRLGELQYVYSVFSQNWKDLDYFTRYNGTGTRIRYLQQQIDGLETIGRNLQKQLSTLQEEFLLAEREHLRQQQLHREKLISDQEMEKSTAGFLGQKRQLENADAIFLQNRMQVKQLESQINDLQQNTSDNRSNKQLTLAEDLHRLRSAIADWKQNYLIIAPISGQVSFSRIWSEQQFTPAGEEVLAVVPANPHNVVGKATVPEANSGKLAPGQRAVVRFENYPAQQYGSVETTVAGIALLPKPEEKETVYQVEMYFPDSMVTSYGRFIPFRQEMTGEVRIVTEDRRMIERFFDRISDLLKNR